MTIFHCTQKQRKRTSAWPLPNVPKYGVTPQHIQYVAAMDWHRSDHEKQRKYTFLARNTRIPFVLEYHAIPPTYIIYGGDGLCPRSTQTQGKPTFSPRIQYMAVALAPR